MESKVLRFKLVPFLITLMAYLTVGYAFYALFNEREMEAVIPLAIFYFIHLLIVLFVFGFRSSKLSTPIYISLCGITSVFSLLVLIFVFAFGWWVSIPTTIISNSILLIIYIGASWGVWNLKNIK